MNRWYGKWLGIVGSCTLIAGCGPAETQDNPTRGSVNIVADAAFRPVIDALTEAYEGIYPRAHFNVKYLPEQEAILALLQDSARIAFVTRTLQDREKAMLKQQASIAKEHRIATDGLAVIVGKDNPDTLMTMQELEAVFKGTITDWSQLKQAPLTGPITLVFDDANSSNLSFLKNRFNVVDFSKLRIIVTGSNEKVVEEIRANPRSIGFIGVNWISDSKEAATNALVKGIRVVSLSGEANPDAPEQYFKPFQEALDQHKYPLARQLYAISREGHAGLGGGLLTYIARDVGGLIIMKMGLVPAVPYHRDVFLKTD